MDSLQEDSEDVNRHTENRLSEIETEKSEDQTDGEDDSESNSLLPPKKGGMSRKSDKTMVMKVQWNDKKGDKLAEVLEFDPSEASDSDEEETDSCICTIM